MDITTISPVNGSKGPVESEGIAAPAKTELPETRQVDPKNRENQDSLSMDQMKELADDMNEIMDDLQTSIGFSIREENNQVIVQIKNRDTDELVRQIPSEELLVLKEKMEEFTGLIFDQSV